MTEDLIILLVFLAGFLGALSISAALADWLSRRRLRKRLRSLDDWR